MTTNTIFDINEIYTKQLDDNTIEKLLLEGSVSIRTIINNQILPEYIINNILLGMYNTCTEDDYFDSSYISNKQQLLKNKK